jgi:hypothetical protein
VLFTVTNLTLGQLDAGPFGLLQAGVTKTIALPASVFEPLAPMLASLVSKNYMSLVIAVDPNTSVGEQVPDFQQTVQPTTAFSEVSLSTPTTVNSVHNQYQYTATAGGYKGLLSISASFGGTAGVTAYMQVLSDPSAVPTTQRLLANFPLPGSTGGATWIDNYFIPIEPNANIVVNTANAQVITSTIYKITQ